MIGLQSTGEASTDAALRTRGHGAGGGGGGGADDEKGSAAETTSTDYISAPQQTMIRVIERCFALPPRPRAMREQEKKEQKVGWRLVWVLVLLWLVGELVWFCFGVVCFGLG